MTFEKTVLRIAAALPPIVLLVAGLFMLTMGAGAWGAAEHVGIPAWMTTASGVLLAAPAIVVGGLSLRQVLKNTVGDYQVFKLHLFGAIGLLLAAVPEVAVALRIADPASYDSFRNATGEATVSPSGFLVLTVFPLPFIGGFVAGLAYMYTQAFQPRTESRFERAPDELDVVGEMMSLHPRRPSTRS